jgi:hypothetical protein
MYLLMEEERREGVCKLLFIPLKAAIAHQAFCSLLEGKRHTRPRFSVSSEGMLLFLPLWLLLKSCYTVIA